MFTADMRERSNNLIKLTGIDCDILSALLNYIYTSTVSITETNVQSMLEAADLLQFNSVKKACENFLIRFLDVDNCLGMHSFAELHVCPALEQEAQRVMLSRFEDLMQQEEFLEVDYYKLSSVMGSESLNVWKEEVLLDAVVKWITHDLVNRVGHVEDLLRCIHLELDVVYFRAALDVQRKCLQGNERKVRYYHCSVALRGCVYAIGGYRGGAILLETEYYDPLKKKWFPTANMIQGVGNATACVMNDTIYVTGGHYGSRGSSTYEKIQSYRSDINEWDVVTITPHPEYGLCSISLNNKLYLVGGQTTITDCYDPERDEWRQLSVMKERRMECGAVVINGCIYVTGGYSYSKGTYLDSIEKYDPDLDTWEVKVYPKSQLIMAENQEMSELETKVARQIEYYFGDHNLPRDKFLKEQLQLDDGWVTLETMLKFNRLKCLTSDENVIVESLKKSKTGLLEISEDKTKVRRIPSKPLPEWNDEYKDAVKHKSVYIKGFPLETTLDEIEGWLKGKGPIENIQMRRNLQKNFKGSVFLVFDTDEAAKQFLERTDTKSFKENEMLVLLREDYHTKKLEERKQSKAEAKAKAKNDKDEKQKQAEDEEMKSLDEQTGCLLKFSGNLENVSREDFHEVFSGHGQIKWIDYTRGAKEGTILFKVSAKEALDKAKEANGGNLQIKHKDITWEVVEGDAEKETLKKIIEDQQESFNRRRGSRGGRKSGGRGRGGRRDRGGRDGKSHYQGKKIKFDDSGDDGEAAAPSPKKRALEEPGEDGGKPAAKVLKSENGS
ncbi:hypothetical protein DPEC_G00046520 [Dallia pectoralis]|uniref:Uncharacterized protein n=1 Tax=Dallia pectoralis TaxID=75939 RepID=A0ACC2HA00_DALPE|nr:hypothetical protein DPEC_G00046520 [Dallia pectoralis]